MKFTDLGTVTNGYKTANSRYSLGYHTGVDVVLKDGAVRSLTNGKVVKSGYDKSYGNHVIVDNKDGTFTLYGHMKNPSAFRTGSTVTKGALLGQMGSSGKSTGPHLHLEVRTKANDYKSNIDPAAYFAGKDTNSQLGGIMTNTGKGAIAGTRPEQTLLETMDFKTVLIRIVLIAFGLLLLYAAIKKGFLGG